MYVVNGIGEALVSHVCPQIRQHHIEVFSSVNPSLEYGGCESVAQIISADPRKFFGVNARMRILPALLYCLIKMVQLQLGTILVAEKEFGLSDRNLALHVKLL